jgi:hypothetical protein
MALPPPPLRCRRQSRRPSSRPPPTLRCRHRARRLCAAAANRAMAFRFEPKPLFGR